MCAPAMHPAKILRAALRATALDGDTPSQSTFDIVGELLCAYGDSDLANRLYADVEVDVAASAIASLFNILVWDTCDNGSEITHTMQDWLIRSQDERQIQVALSGEVYPFADSKVMARVLQDVEKRFPSVASRCAELVRSRAKLRESFHELNQLRAVPLRCFNCGQTSNDGTKYAWVHYCRTCKGCVRKFGDKNWIFPWHGHESLQAFTVSQEALDRLPGLEIVSRCAHDGIDICRAWVESGIATVVPVSRCPYCEHYRIFQEQSRANKATAG